MRKANLMFRVVMFVVLSGQLAACADDQSSQPGYNNPGSVSARPLTYQYRPTTTQFRRTSSPYDGMPIFQPTGPDPVPSAPQETEDEPESDSIVSKLKETAAPVAAGAAIFAGQKLITNHMKRKATEKAAAGDAFGGTTGAEAGGAGATLAPAVRGLGTRIDSAGVGAAERGVGAGVGEAALGWAERGVLMEALPWVALPAAAMWGAYELMKH